MKNIVLAFLFYAIAGDCRADTDKAFCNKLESGESGTDLQYVSIFHGYYEKGPGALNSYPIKFLIRRGDNTVTKSSQPLYVESLYSYLCEGDFEKTDTNWFEEANNYIAVFFNYKYPFDKKTNIGNSDEIFSSDGEYLYAGDGSWRKEVNKDFRLRFHFSSDDLSAFTFH